MPLFCQRKRSEFSRLLCCGGGARHVARLYTGPFVLASEQARHQLLCVFEDPCIRIVDGLMTISKNRDSFVLCVCLSKTSNKNPLDVGSSLSVDA